MPRNFTPFSLFAKTAKMLKIEIISRETIKPSSSTPNHLRNFRLSLIDQFIPPFSIPLILYYPYDEATKIKPTEMSSLLKTSLSDALTLYYPLSGRMKGESWVDCNDEGVDYSEAKVEGLLSDTIEAAKVEELTQFVPELTQVVQLGIKINLFSCGGIAIGISFSHRAADACTLTAFVKAWAALARGETHLVVTPSFISSSIFPPKEPLGYNPRPEEFPAKKPISRRFCFDASKIADLRAEVQLATAGSCLVQPPTRVQLVTALIWKRLVVAQFSGVEKWVVGHQVNIRGRMDPPLPECTYGNLLRTAYASTEGEVIDLGSLVKELREGIGKIDSEFLRELRGENGYGMIMNNVKKKRELLCNEGVRFFSFTSWCRFPIYEADFGWGRPVWVSSARRTIANSAILMDSASGDGIEAWITMDEEEMRKFEQDSELLNFVSST